MAQNVNPSSQPNSELLKQNNSTRNTGSDSHAVTKRLHKELMTLMMSQDKGISAFPEGEHLFSWIGTIQGPDESAYENLRFKLSLHFPNSYPYSAPEVKFLTPCFHPNVDTKGNICLDILKDKWSPLYDVRTILLSIQALLSDANIDSPLNALAAEKWGKHKEYKKLVLETYKEEV